MLELILLSSLLLPLAWLASEFQRHRWISVVLGCASLAIVPFVAYAWAGITTTFDKNVHFGEASKSLAATIVQELEAGNVDRVKSELAKFIKSYDPNYENYPRYDDVVRKTVARLQED